MDGYAFIAFHGSWNRDVPTGYKVVYIRMNSSGLAIGDPIDLMAPMSLNWTDGFRPVDVDFDQCGRLIVSSDGTKLDNGTFYGSKIVRISYIASESDNATNITNSGTESLSDAANTSPSVASESLSSTNFIAHHPLVNLLSALVAFFLVMRVHR